MTGTGMITKIKIWLSGAFALALVLSLFAVSQASTEVLWITPKADTCSVDITDMGYIAQSFIATADTIKTASFFCGKERPTGNYYGYINTSSSPGGTSAYGLSVGKKYQDVEFNFNVGVTRGQRYYFVVQHTGGGSPQGLEYYYREGSAYLYGSQYLNGTQDTTKDLCARVTGVNRIDSTFWGMNGYVAGIWGDATRDSITTQAKWMGINITREQMEWKTLKPTKDGAYNWDRADSGFYKARNKGIRVMINFFGSPAWASSKPPSVPDDSACLYPPKNLDKPLGDTANYLWQFACSLANHYKVDSFRVHDYEIWNEMNFYDWFRYGIGRDTFFYRESDYSRDQPGRAKLYVRACLVAKDAIRSADPQARIYTNAVLHMNIPTSHPQTDSNIAGRYWMQYYYDKGGKDIADVITRHWYQDLCWGSTHRFLPGRFIADYDTLRRVMRDNGEGSKPVWADEGGWGSPADYDTGYFWKVSRPKQADIAVQAFVTGLGQLGNEQGPAIGQVNWYQLYDCYPNSPDSIRMWEWHAGLLEQWWNGGSEPNPYKPSGYAYRQMTQKLKDKYFNRRVPLADTNVYCYEFQRPGPDTSKKTWVVWRAVPKQPSAPQDSLPCRTNTAYYDSTYYRYPGPAPRPITFDPNGSGKGLVTVDTVPLYVYEDTTVSLNRPDIIIDSLYTYPSYPKAGDYVFFYARLKNIGNATLSANLGNAVKFQVDGVTKATYTDSRAIMKDSTIIVGYNPYPPPGDGSIYDWKATWGDHLIRAWADSADRYVELREDNNTKYLCKHFQPKVSVVINNDHKFTNHLNNDTLHVVMNESTAPLPDSAKLKHQGTWTKIGVYGSRDTAVSYSGNGIKYDSVRVWQSGDTASAGDTIIVDITAPRAQITSPAHGATVSGTVNINGYAYDYGPTHFLVDTLRYFRNSTQHDTIHVSWVNIYGGVLGTWNTLPVANGWTRDTLVVRDSAGNVSRDSISLNVYNNITDGGASWVTGFGTYSSPVMNVATDIGGNVYLAETQNSKVRKYSTRKDSLFAFSARRGNDTTGLNWAVSMALKDSTTLYVVDGYAHCTKAFDRQGNLLLRFGSFGSGQGQFRQPCGIALDPKGRVFVVDRLNHRVQVFSDTSGAFLFQFGGQGQDSGKFNSPTGIAITLKNTLLGIAQDLIWVSDTKNNQIQVFDSLGNYLKTIKQPDTLGFDTPTGICSDKWGDIYVADTKHNRIVELNPYGQRILDFGGLGDSLWQFRNPVGVATSPGAHYLYVADMGNRRVQRFTVILEDSSGGGPQGGAGVQVLPMVYELGPAIPNPLNGATTIRYSLPKESQVNFTIYNVAGQVVKEYKPGKQEAGFYSYKWDGRSNRGHKVGAGVYFYRLEGGSWAKTRKMVVIR